MPPKTKTPAPIDKPLSRAYLREFTGWSTAYPPGISDPTSLRRMENVMINRDGSARVRPGLRYLSFEDVAGTLKRVQKNIVGTHEPFFLNDGSKAYLFAVRESDNTVGFRVLSGNTVISLTAAGFTFPVSEASIAFSDKTTWVKYLQIDNKIFALSDAGETMRLFYVGVEKQAKAMLSIERPLWENTDKLSVYQPDASWLNNTIPSSVRTNHFKNPDMEVIDEWNDLSLGGTTLIERTTTQAESGTYSLRISSKPIRTNWLLHPIHNMATYGAAGWTAEGEASSLTAAGTYLDVNIPSSAPKANTAWAKHESFPLSSSLGSVKVAFDTEGNNNVDDIQVRIRFLDLGGAIISTSNQTVTISAGRKVITASVPSGTVSATLWIGGNRSGAGAADVYFKDVIVCDASESTAAMDGSDGTNYFWTGTTNDSTSVYHPPQDLLVSGNYTFVTVAPGEVWNLSAYFRSSGTARACSWVGQTSGTGAFVTDSGATTNDASGAWTRVDNTVTIPAGHTNLMTWAKVAAVPRGEYHYIDSALLEIAATPQAYFDGGGTDTSTIKYEWAGTAHNSKSTRSVYPGADSIPAAETRTANTLQHSTRANNQYNFGFFYTFSNEVGESAASRVTQLRTQRAWSQWAWELPNASGEPNGTETADPAAAADQLVAVIPTAAWQAALDQGATHWNLYVFTWSDQDPVPVTALRVGRRAINPASTREGFGWLRVTADMADSGDLSAPIPKLNTRYNYSDPSRGGNGLVASDRMVMVFDPTAQNVVRWSSNQVGQYSDFSASRGGGYKTLTYGNLYVPAAVKLWQNPQSVDTLTVLCLGVDGKSTSYYMAPSTVSSQSEQVQVMGFEETTATPGTVAPFGVEVFNNALYHPLDEQLMKTTANNYNINHKSQTDQIEDVWKALTDKLRIRSSMHDGRLYYLVNNPQGAPLEDGCFGNEVWVMDAGAEKSSWSRWLVQGHSLRRVDAGGRPTMSVVKPDGVYYFDDLYGYDDYVDEAGLVQQRAIPWYLETNTQGANRAHDAWCQLQQANVTLGNFQGQLEYGVRGLDVNGKHITIKKVTRSPQQEMFSLVADPNDMLSFDFEDYLLVRKGLKEWFFFAGSTTDEVTGEVDPSFGSINLVQYRYTPISVNVGYEYGSIETFEYGRAGNAVSDRTTDNGVPMPMIDTARP